MKTATRSRLSHDRIVAAGLEIARKEGIESLTMRRVAHHLGAGTMSIYHYVENRDALLVAMLDKVALNLEHPAPKGDAIDEIVSIYSVFFRVFRDQPWLVETLSKTNLSSMHILPLVERIYVALEALSFDDTEIVELYFVMLEYTFGKAINLQSDSDAAHSVTLASDNEIDHDYAGFPALARVERRYVETPGSYQRGLRRILDAN